MTFMSLPNGSPGLRVAETLRTAIVMCLLFSSADAGEGDAPTEDDRIQQSWAAIDVELLGDITSYRLGVLEQRQKTRRRTEEARFKQIWLKAESRSFSRLVTDLLADTDTFRRRREKLRHSSEVAARFTQAGVSLPTYGAGFVDLVMMTGVHEVVRERMRREIGPLAAEDFVGHSLFGVVSSNGEVEPPPPSLLVKVGSADGEMFFRGVREAWSSLSADLSNGREPSEERLASLRSICDDWERTIIADEKYPGPAAVNYVRNLRRLAAAVESPGERGEVRDFLKQGGHGFRGGNYGDLLFHVLKHRLSPKAGTPGSLAVAELTHVMIKRADVEIAALDGKLDELKRQNPAHNAVLRERMVPQYFSDKSSVGVHAGINCPAYQE